MKLSGLIFALALASLLPVAAQVTVEVTLEQEQFLPAEKLPAAVRVTNRSGQTLHFGSEPDWLTFSVESGEGFIVIKTGEVPVLGEFTLESAKVATRRVDLAPYFALTRTGRYKIIATVRIKEWDKQINSSPKPFDIIQGAKLWSQEFGVPEESGAANRSPEVRRYTLQQANYLRTQPRLYLKLSDASETRVMKVFSIGPLVAFSRPEPELDKWSNLHLLYQTGARSFSYTVINPDGELAVRQTYEYVNSRPKLHVGKDDKFFVTGGVRRLTADDLPASKSNQDDVKLPKS